MNTCSTTERDQTRKSYTTRFARNLPLQGAIRASVNTAIFLLKVLPTLPSRPVNWVTSEPVRERVCYPPLSGMVEGELTRPGRAGPHPGVLLCLGVVPFDKDHPQVPRLQEALARAGFASLLYWSPAMRDYRLDPADVANLAMAYEWFVDQGSIDPGRSGMIGTCVGGAFVLMAAAQDRIRDGVQFVGAFAPFASMRTLAEDIATATRPVNGIREPWAVDPLTRKVFVHSLTAYLDPTEADRLREAMAEPTGRINPRELSTEARIVYPLLTALTLEEADQALDELPHGLRDRLDAMSPLSYLPKLKAPLLVLMHDRDDPVIPIAESKLLRGALANWAGLRYTEFTMFKHMDPTKVHLHILPLLRELTRFYRSLYPMFRQAAT
jgi:dienelactone hydrolase